MKVLITGGAGFIGSHLVESFQGEAEIRVLDDLSSGKPENLGDSGAEVLYGSILDRNLVKKAVQGVDFVFHLAAVVSVTDSMKRPRTTVETNVLGLLNVLEESATAGVKKLCFASSAAIYGESPQDPKMETVTPDPRSPYAVTKLDGEYYCRIYQREGRLPTVSLRFFNVFGPRQDPNSSYAAAVPVFFKRALAHKPITIFGDGCQTRDFIYVKDIVGALSFAAENPDLTGVVNVGYGQSVTITELATRICRLTNSRSKIVYLPPRPGDIRHSTADPSMVMRAGWTPKDTLNSGLEKIAENCPYRRKDAFNQ